jgi:hypothetical protein
MVSEDLKNKTNNRCVNIFFFHLFKLNARIIFKKYDVAFADVINIAHILMMI